MVVINPLHAVSMLPPLPSRWLSHHGKGNNYQQCDSTHADTHTETRRVARREEDV